jgi:hypothetical protein
MQGGVTARPTIGPLMSLEWISVTTAEAVVGVLAGPGEGVLCRGLWVVRCSNRSTGKGLS